MICPSPRCTLRGKDQPEDEFKSSKNGQPVKNCRTCRGKGARYQYLSYHNMTQPSRNTGGIHKPVEELTAGNEPRFNFEWERARHWEWLRGLVRGPRP